mgnify:CR=1 FL=1
MRSLNPCFSGTYSRRPGRMTPKTKMGVLILVLVEHTLGDIGMECHNLQNWRVLILVLVEHTLGGHSLLPSLCTASLNPCFSGTYSRSSYFVWHCANQTSLNPCFSGTYSRRARTCYCRSVSARLNPCFSGTYSRRTRELRTRKQQAVLILVLVEHTLGDLK